MMLSTLIVDNFHFICRFNFQLIDFIGKKFYVSEHNFIKQIYINYLYN